MANLIKQTKNFFKKFKPKGSLYEKDRVYPRHDWKVLVITAFVVLVLMLLSAFYFYRQINEGTIFMVISDDSTKEVTIKNALLKKVVDDFNQRETNLQRIQQNEGIPSDPSL